MKPGLNLNNQAANRLFPLSVCLDELLTITGASDQFLLMFGPCMGQRLSDFFNWDENMLPVCDEVVELATHSGKLVIEGVFHQSAANGYLFRGRLLKAVDIKLPGNSFESSLENIRKRKFINDNDLSIVDKIGKAAHDNTIGIIISDNQGRIEWVNSAFLQTTGYTKEEVKGNRPSRLIYGEESDKVPVDYVDTMVKQGKPFTFENIGYTKAGKKFWFKATVHPFFDANEVQIGRFSTFEDISAQKENETLLLKSEELWRFAIEGTGDGVWVLNPIDFSVQFSGRYKELLGYNADDVFTPEIIANLVHPDDMQEYFDNILPAITINEPMRVYEHRLRNKDGSYRYYQGRGKAVEWDENQKITKIIGTLTDVHEVRVKDIFIKRYTQQLTQLLEHLDEGIIFEDEHGEPLLINNSFFELFGLDREATNLPDFTSARQTVGIARHVNDAIGFTADVAHLCSFRNKKTEEIIQLKDGRVFSRDYLPVTIDGRNAGQIWKYRDISERISRETELNDLKLYYERILNEIPADIVLFSPQHKYSFINRYSVRNEEMRQWLLNKDDYDYCIHKGLNIEFANRRRKFFDEVLRSRKEIQFIEELRKPDGSIKYLLRIFSPCIAADGSMDYVMGYGVDITDLKRIQAELQSQKEYYHQILDAIPSDVVVVDPQNRFKYINRSAIKDDDLREYLLGKTMEDYCRAKNIPLDLAETRKNLFDELLRSRKEIRTIEEFGKDEEKKKYVLRVLFPYFNTQKELEYVIAYGTDVSEQIRNEKLALIQGNRMRNLLEIINDGVIRFDSEGKIYLHNKAFTHIFDVAERSIVDEEFNFFDIFTSEQLPEIKEKIKELAATRVPQTGMFTYILPDGDARHIDYTLTFSSVHADSFYVARLSDVTEIINKETNLNRIIKKERELNNAKSQFVRLTSHELRTPLAIILSNAELLDMLLKAYPIQSEINPENMITRIIREITLMTEILNQLMIISKIEEGRIDFETYDVDIVSCINEIIDELYNPYKDGRTAVFRHPEPKVILHCDRRLFRQAIVNILNNAFKYSPNAQPPEIDIIVHEKDVEVKVRDYGIGIPEKDKEHLFNPFFRASNVKTIQGTGLGLMVVEYVVNKHNGKLTYITSEQAGTTFNLVFPNFIQHEEYSGN